MREILFVCTGNTCRSPMAEALARAYTHVNASRGELSFFSRGISAVSGSPASTNAVLALLINYGIDLSRHSSERITAEDLARASMTLCVTAAHKNHILKNYTGFSGKVFTVAELSGKSDISDPYCGDLDDYSRCAAIIKEAVENIDFLRL